MVIGEISLHLQYMNTNHIILQFSKHLFWDTDPNSLDMETNAAYIVQRVLEYGQLKDWYLLKEFYGLERIKEIAIHLRSLDPKALSYITAITNTPREQFRCYISKR